VNEDL
jgi:hypothetical protein